MSSINERNLMKNDTTEYETPKIEDHGDLTELTAGKSNGAALDKSYPVGTLKEDLTFSTP
jgi:hypothetical protein